MAKVIGSRMSAEMEGEFVVFLMGMKVNKPRKLHKWIGMNMLHDFAPRE